MNSTFLTTCDSTMYERDIRIYTVIASQGAGKVTCHENIVKNIFYQKYIHLRIEITNLRLYGVMKNISLV